MNRARYAARVTVCSNKLLEHLKQRMPEDIDSSTELGIRIDNKYILSNARMDLVIRAKSVLESPIGCPIRVPLLSLKKVPNLFAASVNLIQFLKALESTPPKEVDLMFYDGALIITDTDNKTKSIWEHVIACSLKK